ncbi:hypothetical protein [Sphingomonas sp.]|uniref:hypothetical protein n=1 Tax=Sphingomonas sp. TaxID=28214 RepID=UPI000DBBB5AB|nr:hypothetical protein [Sphingomonas sp.]PZT91977.1 MAG: hypothetical protein DI625_14685 [Sphingomonas sp.]
MSGLRTSLKDFYSSSPMTLADIGVVPGRGLKEHWDLLGADYLGGRAGGYDLTVDGTANHFRYEKRALIADGGGAMLNSNMPRGAGAAGNVFTYVAVHKSAKSGQSYLLSNPDNRGVSLIRVGAHAGYVYAASTDGKNIKSASGDDAPGKLFDSWIAYAVACDGTKIYLSVDGAPWGAGYAVDAAGIYPLLAGSMLRFGDPYTTTEGATAALTYWSVKLTDAEIATHFKAMQRRVLLAGGVM